VAVELLLILLERLYVTGKLLETAALARIEYASDKSALTVDTPTTVSKLRPSQEILALII
jgi:hypothetical protein